MHAVARTGVHVFVVWSQIWRFFSAGVYNRTHGRVIFGLITWWFVFCKEFEGYLWNRIYYSLFISSNGSKKIFVVGKILIDQRLRNPIGVMTIKKKNSHNDRGDVMHTHEVNNLCSRHVCLIQSPTQYSSLIPRTCFSSRITQSYKSWFRLELRAWKSALSWGFVIVNS